MQNMITDMDAVMITDMAAVMNMVIGTIEDEVDMVTVMAIVMLNPFMLRHRFTLHHYNRLVLIWFYRLISDSCYYSGASSWMRNGQAHRVRAYAG